MENGDGMKSNEERVTLRSLVVEHALVVVALDMCASPPSRGCDECAPTTTTWLTRVLLEIFYRSSISRDPCLLRHV